MQLHHSLRNLGFDVNQKAEERVQNASKELLGPPTLQYGFKPQLPEHCLHIIQRWCPKHYMKQEQDSYTIVAEIPTRPFHVARFSKIDELLTQKRAPSEVDAKTLPMHLEYCQFSIQHRETDFEGQQVHETNEMQ